MIVCIVNDIADDWIRTPDLSGVESDHSINCATTPDQNNILETSRDPGNNNFTLR